MHNPMIHTRSVMVYGKTPPLTYFLSDTTSTTSMFTIDAFKIGNISVSELIPSSSTTIFWPIFISAHVHNSKSTIVQPMVWQTELLEFSRKLHHRPAGSPALRMIQSSSHSRYNLPLLLLAWTAGIRPRPPWTRAWSCSGVLNVGRFSDQMSSSPWMVDSFVRCAVRVARRTVMQVLSGFCGLDDH